MSAAVASRLSAIIERAAPGVAEYEARRPAPPVARRKPAPVVVEPDDYKDELRPRPAIKVPLHITTLDLPSRVALHHVIAAVSFRNEWDEFGAAILTRGGDIHNEATRRQRDIAIAAALTVGATGDACCRAFRLSPKAIQRAQVRVEMDKDMRRQTSEVAGEALRAEEIRAKAKREEMTAAAGRATTDQTKGA